MGGHGALVLALKNPSAFKSVSAFAPICNPTQVPWGKKAFAGYLGDGWQVGRGRRLPGVWGGLACTIIRPAIIL